MGVVTKSIRSPFAFHRNFECYHIRIRWTFVIWKPKSWTDQYAVKNKEKDRPDRQTKQLWMLHLFTVVIIDKKTNIIPIKKEIYRIIIYLIYTENEMGVCVQTSSGFVLKTWNPFVLIDDNNLRNFFVQMFSSSSACSTYKIIKTEI